MYLNQQGQEPLAGLGESLELIKSLCKDDTKAIDAIDRVCKREHGGDRKSKEIKIDNVQDEKEQAPTGNTKAAALRRLRKDRPDLHEKVLNKDMSANAAMIQAGFRKKQTDLQVIESKISKLDRQGD